MEFLDMERRVQKKLQKVELDTKGQELNGKGDKQEDRVCHKCQKKGHLAKNCTVNPKKSEDQKKSSHMLNMLLKTAGKPCPACDQQHTFKRDCPTAMCGGTCQSGKEHK